MLFTRTYSAHKTSIGVIFVMDYNISKIGEIIHGHRKDLNLSQEELATRIGVTRQALSKWEKGKGTEITLGVLLNLCKEFDCDFGHIVGEYPCKRKEVTDIQAATGLSEYAIEKLIEINRKKSTIDGSGKLFLLNAVLEDYSFLSDAANVLYALYSIPENANFAQLSIRKNDSDELTPLLLTDDIAAVKRLYRADLQNVIFKFLEKQI